MKESEPAAPPSVGTAATDPPQEKADSKPKRGRPKGRPNRRREYNKLPADHWLNKGDQYHYEAYCSYSDLGKVIKALHSDPKYWFLTLYPVDSNTVRVFYMGPNELLKS